MMISGTANLFALAAAPAFASIALLTGIHDAHMPAMICSSGSPLGGMAPMYLLMSAFHIGPWLRLFSGGL